MIPKIAAGGSSFKGCFKYYLHDKGTATRERVAWTHTENLLTDDPDKAWKVMAYTAKEAERLKEATGQKMTGRKLAKPVFSYSLAWHPEQTPDKEHMIATARGSLDALGLGDHQAIFVAHRDEPHRHVHIIVNRVHSLTGIAADIGNSKLKLSDFALKYEREHGKVYCPQREENHRKRKQGEKTMYSDPNIVAAWQHSKNGQEFAAVLMDKGYKIAQGRKRLVIVDPYGQTHNPTRHLKDVRARQFTQRIQDLDFAKLPDATKLARTIQADNKRRYFESLKHDELLARRKNEMQDRYLEQRALLTNRYADRLVQERETLTEYYRVDEQKDGIAALREKTSNPKWWKRILGIAKREKARLEELESNFKNAQWRIRERLGAIESKREKALSQLNERSGREQQRTVNKIEANRPAGYANEAERERILHSLREKYSHARNGPSMER